MIKFPNSLANTNNSVWCATNWAGFSRTTSPPVSASLIDLNNFTRLTDRMQQGFVNMIYLGRAMLNAGGFNTDPAFQIDPDGGGGPNPSGPVLDPSKGLYWEGISQGAIMGGALTALEPDLTQSVLNVTGMNYSTLLRRSSDSGGYLEIPTFGLYDNYPNQQERPLILSIMQLVWDRGEADGYAHHMTNDPLPNTPAHHVLLQMAYGDHQVSNLAGENEAQNDRGQDRDAGAEGRTALGRQSVPRASRRSRSTRTAGTRRPSTTTAARSDGRALPTRPAPMSTGTRCTGRRGPRSWSCRRTRRASTAAIRTAIRGGRWTA